MKANDTASQERMQEKPVQHGLEASKGDNIVTISRDIDKE